MSTPEECTSYPIVLLGGTEIIHPVAGRDGNGTLVRLTPEPMAGSKPS